MCSGKGRGGFKGWVRVREGERGLEAHQTDHCHQGKSSLMMCVTVNDMLMLDGCCACVRERSPKGGSTNCESNGGRKEAQADCYSIIHIRIGSNT